MMRTTELHGSPRGAFRKAAALAVVGILGIGMSGCGALSKGASDVRLPGGADLGSSPYTLSADFTDVLDLVPQSSVKVDNVTVGRVSGIKLNPDGRTAHVSIDLNGSVKLPAGTTAQVQQTSLLGEKYVALIRPKTATGASLGDGADVPLAATSTAVGVEQVLGALSMVLNGGGIGQFQEISRELQAVSTGRPEEIQGFLETMDTFVSTLDQHKSSITQALDGVNQLSATLNKEKGKIANALDGLSPGMKALAAERKDLVTMLKSLDRLSTVTVRTLNASQKDMVADLKLLDPILRELANSGKDLPNSLEILLTYPFPDAVLKAIKGDYLNVFIVMNLTTPGGDWPQQIAATQRSSAPTRGVPGAKSSKTASPPVLLPPTSSPTPGATGPTVTAPTPEPTDPTPTPTDPTPTPTDPTPTDPTPTPTDPTPTASSTPTTSNEQNGVQ